MGVGVEDYWRSNSLEGERSAHRGGALWLIHWQRTPGETTGEGSVKLWMGRVLSIEGVLALKDAYK